MNSLYKLRCAYDLLFLIKACVTLHGMKEFLDDIVLVLYVHGKQLWSCREAISPTTIINIHESMLSDRVSNPVTLTPQLDEPSTAICIKE